MAKGYELSKVVAASLSPEQGIRVLQDLHKQGPALQASVGHGRSLCVGEQGTRTAHKMLGIGFKKRIGVRICRGKFLARKPVRAGVGRPSRENTELSVEASNEFDRTVGDRGVCGGPRAAHEQREHQKGNNIFLVHGRNEAARDKVARFLQKLEISLIILDEQADKGRTVIEKFLDHSAEVGFAVVLLTADDRGGPRDGKYEDQQYRARQNVWLELGFFVGKLGRSRVCALCEEGVEIPSDYKGVLFEHFDNEGAWKLELAKEIKAAGISVDLNKAVE